MRKKTLQIGLLFFVLFFISSCFLRFETNWQEETRNAEQVIGQDERTKRLDTLCHELPKPNDFELVGKRAWEGKYSVSNYYKTSLNYGQVKQFYDEYFLKNGWKLRDERPNWGGWFKYTKDGNFVGIQRVSTDEYCSINCRDSD